MNETSRQREALKAAYPRSVKWAKKVNLMPSTQVAAIYLRMKSQNRI